jgi:hypothetical protein
VQLVIDSAGAFRDVDVDVWGPGATVGDLLEALGHRADGDGAVVEVGAGRGGAPPAQVRGSVLAGPAAAAPITINTWAKSGRLPWAEALWSGDG